MVSYFRRYFSSTSTEQISPIPPDLSPVSIRLALLFLLLFAQPSHRRQLSWMSERRIREREHPGRAAQGAADGDQERVDVRFVVDAREGPRRCSHVRDHAPPARSRTEADAPELLRGRQPRDWEKHHRRRARVGAVDLHQELSRREVRASRGIRPLRYDASQSSGARLSRTAI